VQLHVVRNYSFKRLSGKAMSVVKDGHQLEYIFYVE